MLAARPLWPALVPGESRCELKQPKQLRELQLKHELEHCVLEGRASSSRTARLACACGAAASLAVLRTLRPSAHSASRRLAIRLRQAARTMEAREACNLMQPVHFLGLPWQVLDMNAVTQDFFGHSLRLIEGQQWTTTRELRIYCNNFYDMLVHTCMPKHLRGQHPAKQLSKWRSLRSARPQQREVVEAVVQGKVGSKHPCERVEAC